MKRKFINQLLFASISMTVGAEPTEAPHLSTSEINNPAVKRDWELTPSMDLALGTTSNAAKLQKETPGTYSKLAPSVLLEYVPSDSSVFNAQLNADIKQFTEDATKNLADEITTEARGALIWFVSDFWEIGGDLGAIYIENKLPVQISSSETTAQLQKYIEPDSRFYAAWVNERIELEAGIAAKNRKYWTTTEDRGNIYYNDFDQIGADFKAGYTFDKTLKLSLRNLIENKQYKERAADFSDGGTSLASNPNPVLHETSTEHNLIAEYRLGKIKLSTSPGLRFNKDRIFGGRDSQTLKFQQKVTVSFSEKWTWTPSFTYSKENFTKFRSDPENNPLTSPLREDSEFKISSPFKYTIRKGTIMSLDYVYTKKESNYADNSYTENTLQTGLTISTY